MSAKIIEGTALADAMRAEIARHAAELRAEGKSACLACVQVGAKPESQLYVNSQRKLCASLGIDFQMVQLPDSISQMGLSHKIHELNAATEVTGIILELPLPSRLNTSIAQRTIDPNKDAEGVHPINLGLLVYGVAHHAPCTAMAAYQLIKSTGVDLRGLECTVVGHSQIVGRPMGLMMLHDFCTVTTCHIATRDLALHTRRADVLIVAVGKPGLIKADMVKEGAMVIDVGVNRVPVLNADGSQAISDKGTQIFKTVGDVDYDAVREKAAWITPVPGGVGPMTVTMLLRNVVNAARQTHGLNL
ncbi:MAG TPA: bifunctional 5,10-methylenetetrahydrofolate dehydrogenase/5,10-methenyltetrahydrofolate cyclohydrolase [Planctomycetota bacterium]|nr:bifunctional 5,10-methylenetetrahydrofolate dehydrogenase/5,10-methenyltetrahydrofolate cyclohydrolase [Planctomycetota bacterium]